MTTTLMLHRADGAPLSTSFRRAAFGKDDPFAREREIAWERPDSMIAGRVSFSGELDVASFPHTETIVVVDGELSLTTPGAIEQKIRANLNPAFTSYNMVKLQ